MPRVQCKYLTLLVRVLKGKKKLVFGYLTCVQTSPISFVARGTKEIGDVCTQAIGYPLFLVWNDYLRLSYAFQYNVIKTNINL